MTLRLCIIDVAIRARQLKQAGFCVVKMYYSQTVAFSDIQDPQCILDNFAEEPLRVLEGIKIKLGDGLDRRNYSGGFRTPDSVGRGEFSLRFGGELDEPRKRFTDFSSQIGIKPHFPKKRQGGLRALRGEYGPRLG